MWDIGIHEHFTLCGLSEVHLTLENIFFDTHMVDVRHKPVCLWCAMMNMNMIRTPMVGGAKLHLVSVDHIKNEQVVVVVQLD